MSLTADDIIAQLRQLMSTPQSVTVDGMTVQYRSLDELLDLLSRLSSSDPAALVCVPIRGPSAIGGNGRYEHQ